MFRSRVKDGTYIQYNMVFETKNYTTHLINIANKLKIIWKVFSNISFWSIYTRIHIWGFLNQFIFVIALKIAQIYISWSELRLHKIGPDQSHQNYKMPIDRTRQQVSNQFIRYFYQASLKSFLKE